MPYPAVITAGLALLLPMSASAQIITTFVGTFNIVVGIMLVAAFLIMGVSWVMWAVRLGTFPTYRDEAIELMEYSVVILFVLGVMLFVAQFVQNHTGLAMFALGLVIAIAVIWFGVKIFAAGGDDEAHH